MNTTVANLKSLDALPRYNRINHKDRLGMMVFFALAFHAVLILGLSFDLVDEETLYKALTLDVTVVSSKSIESIDDADYLAQEDQMGGGNTQEKVQPSSPFSNPSPNNDHSIAPNTRQELSPPKQEKVERTLAMLTTDNDRAKLKRDNLIDPLPLESDKEKPSIKLLNSSQISDITNRLREQVKRHTNDIDSIADNGVKAKKYDNAFYDSDWQNKVERVGTINYPHAALIKKLTGKVTLEVQINADGTVFNIVILKGSGYKILDNAAKKIVDMAAPFSPLTPEILNKTKVYRIVRVWRFQSGNQLNLGK